MTAKAEGLWDPMLALPESVPVGREDIRHTQSRVVEFHADAALPEDALALVPECKESFCQWLVVESLQFAARDEPRPLRRLEGRAVLALPEASEGDASVDGVGLDHS